jgi:hypothetical protein
MRCGRYDLLNKMYQAMGQWEKAVDVAQKKDRIHLKVTHHQWARELEAAGVSICAFVLVKQHLTRLLLIPKMRELEAAAGDVIASYERVLSHLNTLIAPEYLISRLNRALMQATSRPQ